MIPYKKAISLINKNSITLLSKKISIEKALYKICAKDILSPSQYPSSNNSAFDGFALTSKETKGLNLKKTKKFRILKTIAAGDNPKINKDTINILSALFNIYLTIANLPIFDLPPRV